MIDVCWMIFDEEKKMMNIAQPAESHRPNRWCRLLQIIISTLNFDSLTKVLAFCLRKFCFEFFFSFLLMIRMWIRTDDVWIRFNDVDDWL